MSPMHGLKTLYWQARSRLLEYRLAIANGAREARTSWFDSAARMLRARLRYGTEPLHYSLFRFASVPEREWGQYIFDGPEFKRYLRNLSGGEHVAVIVDKVGFERHCRDHGLPCIPTLGVIGRVSDAAPGALVINSVEQWREALAAAPAQLFIKPLDGTHGEGAFRVDARADGLYAYSGRTGFAEDVFAFVQNGLANFDAWLIQPRLRPSMQVAPVCSPHGLATVRAVTAQTVDGPRLCATIVKIPVGNNVIDNFSGGSTGNLVAAVDPDSGRVGLAWGSSDTRWPLMVPVERHPDTQQPIAGYVLPFWKELVDLALRAQATFPQVKTIGWDIAATDQGLVLVEANGSYDVSLLQIAAQRGLLVELKRQIEA